MKSNIPFIGARRSLSLGAAAIALLFAGGMVFTPDLARAESEVATAGTGWFTEAQVARGQKLYDARCSSCHGMEIADGWRLWDGSAQELVDFIKSMGMPADNPGGLPPQQYIDIVGYIMHHGGDFPFGDEVLVGTDAVNEAKRPE
ncbi:hypothetical protein WH87_10840 [Devosia epidermidihirudinis]|uniref:Cytochrome c domain-containing protein n=1 Tax=Devosia epidermidihirudinis TaxID=1293439 RepID=A0A0F5QAT2_9HYPH|nr:c-type cytochrome [Devosia epidermidihirudinis]KKC38097.1 hypothetical protein WH87_10840 [Devosia epidermidihirudinis]